MVGVPRSQGCRNCRRKKKGCDLQKPICGQCARMNLPCGWDEKKWTFINQEPASSSVPSSRERESDLPVRSRSIADLRQTSTESVPQGAQERSLSRTSFEINSVSKFWTLFLPQDDPQLQYVHGVPTAYWARTLQDLAEFDETVRLGLMACACATHGRDTSDPVLLQEGTKFYAKALHETNKALQDPVKAQSDAVLASCKALSMYENLRIDTSGRISSQGQDWHRHVAGVCKIVELRGPARHVAHHGHALFEEVRTMGVISGMALRKPNFFTNLAWHTIPWETSPRNLKDELHDIMVALPNVLQQQDLLADRLRELVTNIDRFKCLTDGQEHLNRCIFVATSLREWEQKALAACLDTSVPAMQNYMGPITLREVCKNHGFGFFNLVMQFWVTCVVLYSTAWIAYRNLLHTAQTLQSTPLPTLMKLPEVPAWMAPQPMALNIVQFLPQYFSPEAGFWGALCAQFPMGAALHFYAATGKIDSEEMTQLRTLFEKARLGKVTGDFLRSMANTSDSAKGDPKDKRQHQTMAQAWYGTNRT